MGKYFYFIVIFVFALAWPQAGAQKRANTSTNSFLLSYQQLLQLKEKQRYKYIRTVAAALSKIPEPSNQKNAWTLPWLEPAYAAPVYRCLGGGVPVAGSSKNCGAQSYAGFSCPTGKEICNPLIFGVESVNPDKPICFDNATTFICYKRTRVGSASSLKLAFEKVGAKEWDRLKQELDQFCSFATSGQQDKIVEKSYLANDACKLVREQQRINTKRKLVDSNYATPTGAVRSTAKATSKTAGASTGSVSSTATPSAPKSPASSSGDSTAAVNDTAKTANENKMQSDQKPMQGDQSASKKTTTPAEAPDSDTPAAETNTTSTANGNPPPEALTSHNYVKTTRQVTGLGASPRENMGGQSCTLPADTNAAAVSVRKDERGNSQVLLRMSESRFRELCGSTSGVDNKPQIWVPLNKEYLAQSNAEEYMTGGNAIEEGQVMELTQASTQNGGGILPDPNDTKKSYNCQLPAGSQGVIVDVYSASDLGTSSYRIKFPTQLMEKHCKNLPKGSDELYYTVNPGKGEFPFTTPEKINVSASDFSGMNSHSTAANEEATASSSGGVNGTNGVSDNAKDQIHSPFAPRSSLRPQGRRTTAMDENALLRATQNSMEKSGSTNSDSLQVGQVVEVDSGVTHYQDPIVTTPFMGRDMPLIRCDFSRKGRNAKPVMALVTQRKVIRSGKQELDTPIIEMTEETWKNHCQFTKEGLEDEYFAMAEENFGSKYALAMPDNDLFTLSNPNYRQPFVATERAADRDLQSLATARNVEIAETQKQKTEAPTATMIPPPVEIASEPLGNTPILDLINGTNRALSNYEGGSAENFSKSHDCNCDKPHVEGHQLCAVSGPNAHKIQETCQKILDGKLNVPRDAFIWAMQMYRNNLNGLSTNKCWREDYIKNRGNHPSVKGFSRDSFNQGLKNRCQMVINDTDSKYSGFPYRGNMYYIDLCSGEIVQSYFNKGTGKLGTNKKGEHSTIKGAFLTGPNYFNFVPGSSSRVQRQYRDLTNAFFAKEKIKVPAVGLIGLQKSNDRSIADGKHMHASPFKSSWGCPSINGGIEKKYRIIQKLAENGPSLVVHYGKKDGGMEDPRKCSTNWIDYETK